MAAAEEESEAARLRRELEAAKREIADLFRLNQRLSYLLQHTAGGLRGRPGPLEMHGWADLPRRAAAMRRRLEALEKREEEAT